MGFDLREDVIGALSAEEILSKNMLFALLDRGADGNAVGLAEREHLAALVTLRADRLGIKKEFLSAYRALLRAERKATREARAEQQTGSIILDMDGNGAPANTIENYVRILEQDPVYASVRLNLLSTFPEYTDRGGQIKAWDNADDAAMRHYIQKRYGIMQKDHIFDAFSVVIHKRA